MEEKARVPVKFLSSRAKPGNALSGGDHRVSVGVRGCVACQGHSFSNSAVFQAKGHLNLKGQMQASCVCLFLGANTGLCANIHVL